MNDIFSKEYSNNLDNTTTPQTSGMSSTNTVMNNNLNGTTTTPQTSGISSTNTVMNSNLNSTTTPQTSGMSSTNTVMRNNLGDTALMPQISEINKQIIDNNLNSPIEKIENKEKLNNEFSNKKNTNRINIKIIALIAVGILAIVF